MGARWVINRTAAQIHALLYVSPRPLTAEEIANTLSVARSNVSASLRDLQGWGIIRVSHVLGDRRDHFESIRDVWEMFQILAEQRKRREVDPTIAVLRECVAELGRSPGEADVRQRLADLLDLMENAVAAYEEVRSMSLGELRALVRMRGRLRKVLRLGRSG